MKMVNISGRKPRDSKRIIDISCFEKRLSNNQSTRDYYVGAFPANVRDRGAGRHIAETSILDIYGEGITIKF